MSFKINGSGSSFFRVGFKKTLTSWIFFDLIDISFATDVIIYHSMNNEKTQAIGRAHRVGRTKPLYVHTLLYEEEYIDENINF